MMSAIEILEDDHAVVRNLLGRLAATVAREESTRFDLMQRIGRELRVHGSLARTYAAVSECEHGSEYSDVDAMGNAPELFAQTVRRLLSRLAESSRRGEQARLDLIARIGRELTAHSSLEEEFLFPAIRAAGGVDGAWSTSFRICREYRAAEMRLLPELMNSEPGSRRFHERAHAFQQLVARHLDDEVVQVFSPTQKLLGARKLMLIGQRMTERRRELLALEEPNAV